MKDPSGLDLLVALLGTLGAILLLIAAFTAAAQTPAADPTTDRLIIRLADWAEGDRAQPMGAGATVTAAAPDPPTVPAP